MGAPGRTLSQSDWPETSGETHPITIKPETASHMAEHSSWVPSPSCSPPGRPFPKMSLALFSMCVSVDNSFPSVRQEPTLGPWKGSPFLQQRDTIFLYLVFSFFFFPFLATPRGMWDLSSPIRDGTCVPCSGSTESQPLDRQGSPIFPYFENGFQFNKPILGETMGN